jgi:hypothetical protein
MILKFRWVGDNKMGIVCKPVEWIILSRTELFSHC